MRQEAAMAEDRLSDQDLVVRLLWTADEVAAGC